MKVQNMLRQLDFGNSVAEFDDGLDSYFVETDVFRDFVNGKVDIVAGDKGAGKTAIYRYLQKNYTQFPALKDVELLSAFNPTGSPIFLRLVELNSLTEGGYAGIWKAYFLSLAGNWLLEFCEGAYGEETKKLATLFESIGFRSAEESPKGIFEPVLKWAKRLMPRKGGMEITFDMQGIPVIKPTVEFGGDSSSATHQKSEEIDEFIAYDDALAILNSALEENEIILWVLLDRLDESFVGYPDVEVPALRALFRVYLDFQAFTQIKLKLFIRKDLFRKISSGGFVNLTHVNARKQEIIWDQDDLFSLLIQRIRQNEQFLEMGALTQLEDENLFYQIFPPQVDRGSRRPPTWNWMLSRIRDGNGAMPPRNLIDLANKAKDEQLRREQRKPRQYDEQHPLIESESLKLALSRLSKERIEDTLFAESSKDVAALIEGFRDSKAEHNDKSIAQLFGTDEQHARQFARILVDIGFLEQVGNSYKIPMLYRDGLNITRGKAFH